MNTNIHNWSTLAQFFLNWHVSDKFVEKIKTHFMLNNFFPRKSVIYEIIWKNTEEPEKATDDNIAQAHCMLDTHGYKHTLRFCNIHCFPTATMVARTRPNVTLYVHCHPCLCLHITYTPPWLLWSFRIEPTLTETSFNTTWSVYTRKYADWTWNALKSNIWM
jgi:hypothetical protein